MYVCAFEGVKDQNIPVPDSSSGKSMPNEGTAGTAYNGLAEEVHGYLAKTTQEVNDEFYAHLDNRGSVEPGPDTPTDLYEVRRKTDRKVVSFALDLLTREYFLHAFEGPAELTEIPENLTRF
jgi:hypothetical protein